MTSCMLISNVNKNMHNGNNDVVNVLESVVSKQEVLPAVNTRQASFSTNGNKQFGLKSAKLKLMLLSQMLVTNKGHRNKSRVGVSSRVPKA